MPSIDYLFFLGIQRGGDSVKGIGEDLVLDGRRDTVLWNRDKEVRIGVAIEIPMGIYQASHEFSRLTFLKIIELIY